MGKDQFPDYKVHDTGSSGPVTPTSQTSDCSIDTLCPDTMSAKKNHYRIGNKERQPLKSPDLRSQDYPNAYSIFHSDLSDALDSLCDVTQGDPDQLFLLPDRVLTMDSLTFREDVASVAPSFLSQSNLSRSYHPHSSLQNESNKPLRLLDDTGGLILSKAANGCLWLCDTSILSGINNHSGSNSSNVDLQDGHLSSKQSINSIFDSPGSEPPTRPARRVNPNRNSQREREERVRRLRDHQEDERRKKLEELRQHALAAQKFREHQELERRRHLEELRFRDEDKRSQVEERRKAIESAEQERRESLLKKNQEREERIETKRRHQMSQLNFAFGSSTPRIIGHRVDSTTDVWGNEAKRSTSSFNMTNNSMTQSLYSRRSSERDQPETVQPNQRPSQRAISAHGLNQSGEDTSNQSTLGAPPSISDSKNQNTSYGFGSRMDRFSVVHSQPSSPMVEKPLSWFIKDIDIGDGGESKQNPDSEMFGHRPIRRRSRHESHFVSGSHIPVGMGIQQPRPPSAMSSDTGSPKAVGVRLRSNLQPRRPRPISIATTGVMSTSMFEKGVKPSGSKIALQSSNKMTLSDVRRNQNSNKEDDDTQSNCSNSSSVIVQKQRKTVAQVKSENALKKAKKNSLSNSPQHGQKQAEKSHLKMIPGENSSKEWTQCGASADLVRSSPLKDMGDFFDCPIYEEAPADSKLTQIISSEEEAKARMAKKRREVKEQKEKEAELERQRLVALRREEEERRQREEDEEREAQEEADRLAEVARQREKDRLQRAIKEQERREREQREKDEQFRREKEDLERQATEEAEKKRLELEEKLRIEEEERLARKNRIKEIMSRTRGPKPTTPSSQTSVIKGLAASDQNVDPAEPELLGILRNKSSGFNSSTSEIEKRLLDMQFENGKNFIISSMTD